MTNFEKIKNMSIEKMAEFIGSLNSEWDICDLMADKELCRTHDCKGCARKYLESECD